MSFEVGQQPCQDFNPQKEANAHAVWSNQHQCRWCGGDVTVSFCLTCMKDHHQKGWETCKHNTAGKTGEQK